MPDVPEPHPSVNLPPETRSTTAASSATRKGWCIGRSRTFVPMPMRVVRAAIAAATTSGLGRYPSSTKWCSESHTSEKPRDSPSEISSRHSA
nr:hypothetical protein [Rubrobacter marinus]